MVASNQDTPTLCHRCGAELHPGRGDFYVIKIEAYADPTPPDLSPEDLLRDCAAEIRRLVESVEGMSEQELIDQVYRRLTIHLCRGCYRDWIERPAG